MDPRRWDRDAVASWIQESGLAVYSDIFRDNGIDGETLLSDQFDADIQRELIPFIPHRVQFKEHLQKLKNSMKKTEQTCNDVSFSPSTDISTMIPKNIKPRSKLPNIPSKAEWSQNGTTVISDLKYPQGLAIDQDDGTCYIVNQCSNQVISCQSNTNEKSIVVTDLHVPAEVLIDKQTNSIIIADFGNKRILRWSRDNETNEAETIAEDISCWGLTMDDEGTLYAVDYYKHEVRRFLKGDKKGIVVAGGNGKGNDVSQLHSPRSITMDSEGAIYITDSENDRVVKWTLGQKAGTVVAGGNGRGSESNQLNHPHGIMIDVDGNIYVVDGDNQRITRWRKGEKTGEILVGGNDCGKGDDQFNGPMDLCFDQQNNLYVTDFNNHRVQKFSIV